MKSAAEVIVKFQDEMNDVETNINSANSAYWQHESDYRLVLKNLRSAYRKLSKSIELIKLIIDLNARQPHK